MTALPDHRIVALHGRDAAAFAQAQFMSDVGSLAAGHWQWSGWLTPKGRVIALFALLKFADDQLWLLLPDADPAAFAARLQGFVFRSKLTIAARDDLRVTGAMAAPGHAAFARDASAQADAARIAVAADGAISLDLGAAGGARSLRIAATDAGRDEADGRGAWAAFDLIHGLPRLPAAQAAQWTPQQLSLDRLHAYSVRKGCYPGQEIVARTHFLGQAKRGLVLLASPQLPAPGSEVTQAGRGIGSIVCAAAVGDAGMAAHALAVLPLQYEAAPLQVDGIAALPQPLRDGLAR